MQRRLQRNYPLTHHHHGDTQRTPAAQQVQPAPARALREQEPARAAQPQPHQNLSTKAPWRQDMHLDHTRIPVDLTRGGRGISGMIDRLLIAHIAALRDYRIWMTNRASRTSGRGLALSSSDERGWCVGDHIRYRHCRSWRSVRQHSVHRRDHRRSRSRRLTRAVCDIQLRTPSLVTT